MDIKHHLGQPRLEYAPEKNLHEKLGQAECVLLDLKNLIQILLSRPEDSTSVRRYAWFKSKKKIRKLRTKLVEIHNELPKRLGEVEGSRIKLELANVVLLQQQISSRLSRVEAVGDTTSQRVSAVLKTQQNSAETFHSSQQLQQYIHSSVEEIRKGILGPVVDSILPDSSSHRPLEAPKPEGTATSALGKFLGSNSTHRF